MIILVSVTCLLNGTSSSGQNIGKEVPKQTVQTLIRLLKEQSDEGLHYSS